MSSGQRKILVYSPKTLWLALAGLLSLVALGAGVAFTFGKQYAGLELVRLEQRNDELTSRLDALEQQNRELRERAVVLERSSEIDRRASLEVRDSWAALQNELLELRRELEFYRGIVSPGNNARAGLRIQRFEVRSAAEPGHFAYSLTLTQVKRNDRYARGDVRLEVSGTRDGKPVTLPLSALSSSDKAVLKYKFRYFQHFAGELVLPEGFEPRQVTIRLVPRGKGQPAGIETTLDWPVSGKTDVS